MTLDVWTNYVLVRLKALLAIFPPLIEEQRARNIIPHAMDGTLEWTLPWGMDDGLGNVRLTLMDEPSGWGVPKRVRVVVAAKAAAFSSTVNKEAALPRYDPTAPPGPPAGDTQEPRRVSSSMARRLLEHVGGDPDSLRYEADGSQSFTVVVAD
ncbi:hypothetical protein ABZ934_32390 [Streptomyces sp. NPDC046557]|uniref:hypothetical protein n=1 Tax=Streptomyces sp. NPDC046557 TaxID=3155372 RepID=UPI0033F8BEA0